MQSHSIESALMVLRKSLMDIKATGPDGFEGLIADAISAETGLVIRLAKAGSQFGRDGCSPLDLFAVAIETKRYDNDLRLEDLAGKAALARHFLADRVDVWILGATSEVGDVTFQYLSEFLDDRGMSLLVLDWTLRPLPPLAVLLASAMSATLKWFSRYQPTIDLGVALRSITADANFPVQASHLHRSLTASEVGLDALRQKTAEWLHVRFSDRAISQLSFGQFITVNDSAAPAISRATAVKALSEAMFIEPEVPGLVVVLGSEGVGKTWLVAQWWGLLEVSPILFFVAGRRVANLNPSDALESLAKLLAEQNERCSEADISGWRLRLRRWQSQGAERHLRFVVVLDGINEHSGQPWADIIKALAREVHLLGGIVVVTTREAFWQRDVLPRIGRSLSVRSVLLEGYCDEDLAAILAQIGVSRESLPLRLRDFIRNPRVCNVALSLLRELSLQPNELTVERILLEYWRSRLEERSDLISHNVKDFEKLLRSHAQMWLKNPGISFDRDEWSTHSAVAQRHDTRNFYNDLTEIEEGRFLQVDPSDNGAYTFRQETLPFALALLVTHELKSSLGTTEVNANECIENILDAVSGFDIVAEIVGASVGLACLDTNFPPFGRLALIRVWFGLQNIAAEAFSDISAYMLIRPEAFFDVAEISEVSAGRTDRHQMLLNLLIAMRDSPKVLPILNDRLPRWLGRWSRKSQVIGRGDDQARREADRTERISTALAALAPEERVFFNQLCGEAPDLPALRLDRAAALLIGARQQTSFASGIVGWALVRAIAPDVDDAEAEIGWIIRLNQIDYLETDAAVRGLLEPISTGSSEPMRQAASYALKLMGTSSSAELAPCLEGSSSIRWRRVERFCDTNPYNPDAPPGSNLDNARAVPANINVQLIWNHMSNTAPDFDLETVIPILARFDLPIIIDTLCKVVRSIDCRSQLPFRQLAWRLPELSPIFDEEAIHAVETAFGYLIAKPDIVGDQDYSWVTGRVLAALLPHFDAEKQLSLLLQLPPTVLNDLQLRYSLKQLSVEALQGHLELALTRPNSRDLKQVLFFASATAAPLTERSRQIIAEQLNDPDKEVVACAADLANIAQDSVLNALLLEQACRRNEPPARDELWYCRAVAMAIVEQQREDLFYFAPPFFMGHVAAELGGRPATLFAEIIERFLNRLLRPIATREPHDTQMVVSISKDGLMIEKWVEDRASSSQEAALLSQVNDRTSLDDADSFQKRQRQMIRDLTMFEAALTAEGVGELTLPLNKGIDKIVELDHSRVALWLDQLLSVAKPSILRQIHNLGVNLAGAYASYDGSKAAMVLRHLGHSQPVTRIQIEGVPLYEYALFSNPDVSAFDELRSEVFAETFDDAALEAAVSFAESVGASSWLGEYMDRLLKSSHPGNQARGLTIAGFRYMNDRSEQVLTDSWGPGFLGEVAAAATKNYRRAQWVRHWLGCACKASEPIHFWRFGKLAEGIADWRFVREISNAESDLMNRFGKELYGRLSKAAEDRRKKRESTLFGLKAPDRELVKILRNERPEMRFR